MKKQVSFDKSRYSQAVMVYESTGMQALQNVVDVYAAMGNGQLKNIEEVSALIADPKGFVVEKMSAGQPLKILGIPLKKTKVFDLMESPPAGFEEMEAAIEAFTSMPMQRDAYQNGYTTNNLEYYDLVKGRIIFADGTLEMLKEQATKYITGANAVFAYECAEEILQVLNKLANRHGKDSAKLLINECISFPPFGGGKITLRTDNFGRFESFITIKEEIPA